MPATPKRKEFTVATSGALAQRRINKNPDSSVLIREEVGFHMGIAGSLEDTAHQGANLVSKNYTRWLKHGFNEAEGKYRQNYFTIAVGGGNTVKAEFRALLEHHHSTIDWVNHVRFFFLEESSGENKWESSKDALIEEFLAPLASKLFKLRRPRAIAVQLGMDQPASEDEITATMIDTMITGIVSVSGSALSSLRTAQPSR